MAHTAEDAALLLNAMAGFDERDATSLQVPEEDFGRDLHTSIEGLTVGLPSQFFSDGLDNEIATLIEDATKQLEKLGAKIKDIELPTSLHRIWIHW